MPLGKKFCLIQDQRSLKEKSCNQYVPGIRLFALQSDIQLPFSSNSFFSKVDVLSWLMKIAHLRSAQNLQGLAGREEERRETGEKLFLQLVSLSLASETLIRLQTRPSINPCVKKGNTYM